MIGAPDVRDLRMKPKGIMFTIANGAIAYDNGNAIGLKRQKVWTRAGGRVVFIIQNNDDDAYDVTIPVREFTPSPKYGDAPHDPIDERASGKTRVRVAPGDVDALVYVVKPATHFPFSATAPEFTYEYVLHYTNARTSRTTDEDPDLEVSP